MPLLSKSNSEGENVKSERLNIPRVFPVMCLLSSLLLKKERTSQFFSTTAHDKKYWRRFHRFSFPCALLVCI